MEAERSVRSRHLDKMPMSSMGWGGSILMGLVTLVIGALPGRRHDGIPGRDRHLAGRRDDRQRRLLPRTGTGRRGKSMNGHGEACAAWCSSWWAWRCSGT